MPPAPCLLIRPEQAARHREQRFGKRQPQNERGHQRGKPGGKRRPAAHRKGRETEADRRRARVAEEHPRRERVVRQEPGDAAGQQQRRAGGRRLARKKKDAGERECRNEREPGGQSVQAVDNIERVGHADEPDDRQGERQPAERDRVPEQMDDAVQTHPETNRDAGAEYVRRKLLSRPERLDVVAQRDRDDRQEAERDPEAHHAGTAC